MRDCTSVGCRRHLGRPWKDESGKGRWRGDYGWGESDRKFKFRAADGCEVERKWKKGEYEEKVKCKPGRYGYGY